MTYPSQNITVFNDTKEWTTELAGEKPILDKDLRLALHPTRFIIRDLKKKRL